MLYLVRKIGESIIINDNIELKVVETKGKSVKLGFEFPPDATVLRKEIHDRVVQENIMATRANSEDFNNTESLNDVADALSSINLGGTNTTNTE